MSNIFYSIFQRFTKASKKLEDLKRGEGDIIEYHGQKVAAYKDSNNNLHMCSSVCTHMGCQVGWNKEDKTWDCPCHGARFNPEGDVLKGPAKLPLEKISKK